MFFSKKKKPIGDIDLLIDIQSSVVHAALVLAAPDQVSGIQWMMNVEIPHKATTNSAQYIKATSDAITTVSHAAHRYVLDTFRKAHLPDKIREVHCILSSPWIISRARTISHKFAKETLITPEHIANIIKIEHKKLEEGDKFISVEEKVCDVRLNGYSVVNWQGHNAHTLEISFTLGLSSSQVFKHFKDSVHKSLQGSSVSFHSALLLQHAHVQRISPHQTPYLLIHAHGELTDVVVADEYAYKVFATYPMGIRTILRNIAAKLKISEYTADSLVTMHNSGHTDDTHSASSIKVVHEEFKNWAEQCIKIVSDLPKDSQPIHAFVSAHANGEIFCDALQKVHPKMKIELITERTPGTVVYTSAIRHLQGL